MRFRKSLFAIMLSVVAPSLILCVGCGAENAEVAKSRAQWLVDQKPTDVKTIAEAAELSKTQSDQVTDVVITGRISAGDFDPFEKGKATFIMSEIISDPSHPEEAGHDADNCPFCKRKAEKAPKAYVQFKTSGDQVAPIDAQQLFGIKKNDVVYVKGNGKLNDLGIFDFVAQSLYIDRK